MIKFSGGGPGARRLIGFGISRANVEQLMKGHPIKASLDELFVKNTDVIIFFGETEELMRKELQKYIGEATTLIDRKKGVEN